MPRKQRIIFSRTAWGSTNYSNRFKKDKRGLLSWLPFTMGLKSETPMKFWRSKK